MRLLTAEGSSAQQKTCSDLTMELGVNADLVRAVEHTSISQLLLLQTPKIIWGVGTGMG